METTLQNLPQRDRILKLTEEYEDHARIRSLEADVESYQALTYAALGHVRALTVRNDQLQRRNLEQQNEISDLHAELRWLRGFLMDTDRAA
jgi:predicted RNase H-like nuclease (RuvC/YqgF family)